jgi:hypothetical protein
MSNTTYSFDQEKSTGVHGDEVSVAGAILARSRKCWARTGSTIELYSLEKRALKGCMVSLWSPVSSLEPVDLLCNVYWFSRCGR